MRYVVAGYVVILGVLFLYAVALVWRRRRLSGAVARVAGGAPAGRATTDPDPTAEPDPTADPVPTADPNSTVGVAVGGTADRSAAPGMTP